MRKNKPNRPRALHGQGSGCGVGVKMVFIDDIQNTLAHFFFYTWMFVDHPGYSGAGYSSQACNIIKSEIAYTMIQLVFHNFSLANELDLMDYAIMEALPKMSIHQFL
ncbi:MAG: hypothetical protein ACD_35C00174G0001 [uncultured bacterium]|nr:MAG: hypothetical protein ACD_35C00174G0001 [uncultured bacterium]